MNSRQTFDDLKEEITRVEDNEFVGKSAIRRVTDEVPNTPSIEHFGRGRHHMDIAEASARPLRRRRCIIVAVVVVCFLLVSAAVAAGLAVTLSKHAGEIESSTGKTSTLSLITSRTAEISTTTTSTTTTRVSTKPYTTTFTTGNRRSNTISATATDNITIFNNTIYTRATSRTTTTVVSPTASDSTTSTIVSSTDTVSTTSTIVSTTTTDSIKGTIVFSTTTSKITQPSIIVFTSPTTTASSDSGETVPALMTTVTSREVGNQTMMKITATMTPTMSLTSPKTSSSRQTHLPKTTETKRRDKTGTFHWTKRTRITTTPSQG